MTDRSMMGFSPRIPRINYSSMGRHPAQQTSENVHLKPVKMIDGVLVSDLEPQNAILENGREWSDRPLFCSEPPQPKSDGKHGLEGASLTYETALVETDTFDSHAPLKTTNTTPLNGGYEDLEKVVPVKLVWTKPSAECEILIGPMWDEKLKMTRVPNTHVAEYSGSFPPFVRVEFRFLVDGVVCVSPQYPILDPKTPHARNCVIPISLKWYDPVATEVRACVVTSAQKGENSPHLRMKLGKGGMWTVDAALRATTPDLLFWFLVDGSPALSSEYPVDSSSNRHRLPIVFSDLDDSILSSENQCSTLDSFQTSPTNSPQTSLDGTSPLSSPNSSQVVLKSPPAFSLPPLSTQMLSSTNGSPIVKLNQSNPSDSNPRTSVDAPTPRLSVGTPLAPAPRRRSGFLFTEIVYRDSNPSHLRVVELHMAQDGWERGHRMRWDESRLSWVSFVELKDFEGEQFKFVVDGEWKCSPDYSLIQDLGGNINNILISTPLYWKGAASTVLVATSADNWRKPIPLDREPNGTFSLNQPLPCYTSLQFKFIVDGEWMISQHYEHRPFSNSENNILHRFQDGTEVRLAWRWGGGDVQVCLESNGWQPLSMENEGGVWWLDIRCLPRFFCKFKFIVDGVWCTSGDYFPYIENNGIVNNFVIPITLEWTEGGSDVWARSSCDKWAVTHPAKWENGRWVLHLTVPHTGRHEFKFVVDHEWRINPRYPVQHSDHLVNNFFDCF